MTGLRRADGASLVEAAFALPIFFFLFLGLIDFGLLAFNSNQVANAARDGARVGVLGYESADDASSADRDAIRDAILERLPGQSLDLLEISCRRPGGAVIDCQDPTDPTDPAKNADVDADYLRVKVQWSYEFISPIARLLGFDTRTLTGEAQMALVGSPGSVTAAPTTTTTLACEVSGVAISPGATPATAVQVISSPPEQAGKLDSDIDVTVTTNGSPMCPAVLSLAFRGPDYVNDATDVEVIAECGCEGSYRYSKRKRDFWDDAIGMGQVVVLQSGASVASAPIYLDQA